MHNAYMYILANDGIETSNSYPFQGRVSLVLNIPACHKINVCDWSFTQP